MNRMQLRIAHALAATRAHAWALTFQPAAFPSQETFHPEFIRGYVLGRMAAEGKKASAHDVLAPYEDANGVVRHAPHADPIGWEVHPDGAFGIWVPLPTPRAPFAFGVFERAGITIAVFIGDQGVDLIAHEQPVTDEWQPTRRHAIPRLRDIDALDQALQAVAPVAPPERQDGIAVVLQRLTIIRRHATSDEPDMPCIP